MLSTLPLRSLTHGVFWREFAAGQSTAGSPLGEWAYMSPLFPSGLSRSELGNSLPEAQRETIHFWFSLNLKPYDLEGGPWFTFDSQSAGFDNSYFAPRPVSAPEAIDREFGDILSPEMGEAIAAELPGEWMWHAPPSQFPVQPDTVRDEIEREVLKRLSALEDQIASLRSLRGGIGHNSGDEKLPLAEGEVQAALQAIAATRVQLEQAGNPNAVRLAWEPIKPILANLGAWLSPKLEVFATEAAKSVGKRAGDALFWGAVLTAFQHGNTVTELLRLLLK